MAQTRKARKTPSHPKKFGGPLDEPLKPILVSLLLDEERQKAEFAQRAAEEDAKLRLLAHHYGVPEGLLGYKALVLAIARDFIRGFQEPKPRGRKSKWNNLTLGALYVEIQRVIIAQRLTKNPIVMAARVLAGQEHWIAFLDTVEGTNISSDPTEALRRAYFIAKKNFWSDVCWNAYCYHQWQDTIAEWDDMVKDYLAHPSPQ